MLLYNLTLVSNCEFVFNWLYHKLVSDSCYKVILFIHEEFVDKFLHSFSLILFCSTNDSVLEEMKKVYMLEQDKKVQ